MKKILNQENRYSILEYQILNHLIELGIATYETPIPEIISEANNNSLTGEFVFSIGDKNIKGTFTYTECDYSLRLDVKKKIKGYHVRKIDLLNCVSKTWIKRLFRYEWVDVKN